MLYILLAIIAAQALIIRWLAIDPGFKIKTRAAGELTMWLHLGRRDVVYGDIDHLGLINDALTSDRQLGHDRVNTVMCDVFSCMRRADVALVYGGDEIRLLVGAGSGHGAAQRLQALLRDYPLTSTERANLFDRTGKDHISITLAVAAYSRNKREALDRARIAVGIMKPKRGTGARGQIVIV